MFNLHTPVVHSKWLHFFFKAWYAVAISFSSQCSHVSYQHWRGSGAEFVGILPSCHCKRDAVGSCYGTPAMFFWKTPCAFEKLPHFLHLALKPAANLRNTYNITPPNYGPVSGVIEMLTYLFFFFTFAIFSQVLDRYCTCANSQRWEGSEVDLSLAAFIIIWRKWCV